MRNRRSGFIQVSGFTLLELLIVIAIGIVLVALLFPLSIRLIKNAQTTKCVANQKSIVSGILLYAAENDNRLPHYALISENNVIDGLSYWWKSVGPYIDLPKPTSTIGYNYLRCPSADKKVTTTIGVNYSESPDKAPFSISGGTLPGSMKLAKVSAGTALTADIENPAGQLYFLNPNQFALTVDSDGDGIKDSRPGTPSGNWVAPRHNKSIVFGCADGSVKVVTLRDWGLNTGGIWGP